MHQHGTIAPQLYLHLTDSFHKRKGFDITDRTANLNNSNIISFAAREDFVFDFIGNMRNNLYRTAKVFTATFFI